VNIVVRFSKELNGLPPTDASYELKESIYHYFPPQAVKSSVIIPGIICLLIILSLLGFF